MHQSAVWVYECINSALRTKYTEKNTGTSVILHAISCIYHSLKSLRGEEAQRGSWEIVSSVNSDELGHLLRK